MTNCFIVYCDWLCSPYTCILCWTPEDTYDLIIYLAIALTDFIIAHLYLACYFNLSSIYLHSQLTWYMHVHLPFYSYTFLCCSDSLDLHIKVFACYLTDQVFGEDHRHLEESWVLFIRFLVFLLYFIPSSPWFSI